MSVRTIASLSKQDALLRSAVSPLFKTADTVADFGADLTSLVSDLLDTMHAHDICVGLAAPQIGVTRRVAVVNSSEGKAGPDLVLVNPEIVMQSGKKDTKFESCMSVPGWRGPVERRKKLLIHYYDVTGTRAELTAEGFEARAIMHEVDHLSGHLYCQLVPPSLLEETDLFKDYLASLG
jgi:peptide deformylase